MRSSTGRHVAPPASRQKPLDQDRIRCPTAMETALPQWRTGPWSIAHDASPDAVVPRALAYEASAGVDVDDGVRVGLQRSLGDDLPAALKAARYPADMQDALFEETGWRAGDEFRHLCSRSASLQRRCVFVHGAARGRTLRTDWTQPDAPVALATKISAQTCGCEDATWRGAA